MRRILKLASNAMALLLMAPFAGVYQLLARIASTRREAVFQGFTQCVALLPGMPGEYLRRAFLRMTCRRCAWDTSVGFGTIFTTPDVTLDSGVYIGPYCVVGHASIGRDAMLGTGVHLIGGAKAHGTARLDQPIRLQPGTVEFIQIGEDCWIGNSSVVMATVGEHAVVGAGSVVTKPVMPWKVVAGNPAREMRDRRNDQPSYSSEP